MDKEQAKRLIKDTFESPFDKMRFIKFVKNLLNQIEEKPFIYRGNFIPDAFKPYISTLERIGKYTDGEHEIDLLIVKLKRENSLERARAMQRNFIAWYLKGSRGGKLKDAALVAFVSPDEEDWRFSLVKMDYRFEEGKSGRVKVREEFTPARRWSFLVGKNEKSHTAQSRLVSILEDDEHNPTLAQLEEAFNIEPVTKEFFNKYRDLLIRTVDALDKIVKEDQTVRKDFESKNINTVDFAKKLLGQIVFLYFLQKKGWFGVAQDEKWGEGDKKFIRNLFEKCRKEGKNFFNDYLEVLFYNTLNNPRTDQADPTWSEYFKCKIPFLNGGLFEPIGGYDWVHTDIFLPNDLFSNNRRTLEGDIGGGILDVFDRFNFTVKEDEPLEKEVAIDPELLGKLYEKFNAIRPDNFYEYKKALASGKKSLEKQFNKKFGVYYTPREIVHYMCQQSLIYYLSAELDLPAPQSRQTGGKVNKEDIERLIKFGEQFTENEATALIKELRIKEGKQKTSDYELKLPESIRKNAKLIDDKLRDIKICDPAIGSGAFPVGMMHEIVKTRNVLSAFIKEPGRGIYNFKRECIENSLYGVDIDAGACEVAKLRLWLSLIVDEEDIRKIKPLPNLDYKIVCGNSLLGVEKDLFNNELFNQLEKLKPLYFNETNPTKKQEYKNKIEELISKITNGRKEFDFEVYFSEVFHQKGGFDVVIANPPYGVDYEKLIINKLKATYKFYDRQNNSASFFIELAQNVTTNSGVITYIIPKSLSFSKGWQKTRKLVTGLNQLCIIIDVSEAFEEVLLEQIIILFKKLKKDARNYSFYIGEGWDKKINILGESNIEKINRLNILPIYITKEKEKILKKMERDSILLSETSKTFRGLPLQKRVSSRGMPILRGKNISKYRIYGNLDKVPKQYLSSAKLKDLVKPKIVSQNIVAHVRNPYDRIIIMATLDRQGLLSLDTVMNTILTTNDFCYEYILALINSTLASWFYYWFVYNRAVRTMHFDSYYMEKLPIKKILLKDQQPFVTLVNQILSLTQSEDYLENPQKQARVKEYERQIDQLVYKLYELTDEEIEIVEGFSEIKSSE